MLAIFSRTKPKSAITLLNALRCLAYPIAFSSETRPPPTHMAPSLNRPPFRILKAITCPLPISPSRFSTGTLQSFRMMGQVDEPRIPIDRSEEHTSELQSLRHLVCRLLLEKK